MAFSKSQIFNPSVNEKTKKKQNGAFTSWASETIYCFIYRPESINGGKGDREKNNEHIL